MLNISIIILLFGINRIWVYCKKTKEKVQEIYEKIDLDGKNESMFLSQFDELRFLKTHQWNIAYYCLLLFGGLIGVHQIIKTELSQYFLIIFSTILFCIGIFLIIEQQFRMTIARLCALNFHNKNFRDSYFWITNDEEYSKKILKNLNKFWNDWYITGSLFFTIFMGYIIVLLYFFRIINLCLLIRSF